MPGADAPLLWVAVGAGLSESTRREFQTFEREPTARQLDAFQKKHAVKLLRVDTIPRARPHGRPEPGPTVGNC